MAVVVTVLPGCGETNQFQPPPPPAVTVALPIQRTVTNFLEETGTTEPVQRAELRARVRGFLEEIRFEPGTDVKQGDVLFIIEQDQYRVAVAAAEAEVQAVKVALERAEIELQREEQLLRDNATAERTYVLAKAQRDGAAASLAAAEANLEQAQLDLDYTEVKAPFDGRIGKALVKVGNFVDEAVDTHLATIVTYDPIYANFTISEQSLLELMEAHPPEERKTAEKQIPIMLRRAKDPDFSFQGRLEYSDLGVDQSSGTFALRGIFPNTNMNILPGLFVRVRLPIGRLENALLVQESSIVADQGGRYVLIVNDEDTVERRNVTLGSKYGELMVIESGLEPDDLVVSDGIQRARPGAKVQPKRSELEFVESDLQVVEEASWSETDGAEQVAPDGTDTPIEEMDEKTIDGGEL